jgi:ribonuclease HI
MKTDALRLYAVLVRELDGSNEALDWLLYTNAPVLTSEHAQRVVASYQARWRVEEFHRTWKQGECNVEDTQLRSQDAVVKWATLLSAVATRIERLKYLSRSKPNAPASCELAAEEIEALKLDQRRRTRRRLPQMPSIGDATRWIGELGGWIGARNGQPGSVTLARGLERLGYLVEGIALARPPTQGRRRT